MRKTRRDKERERMLSSAKHELDQVQSSLIQAYSLFNNTSDPDLVEASILEISALRSKYSRTLRDMKKLSEA